MDQYVGKAVSKKIYPEWRGGYYYAAKPICKGSSQSERFRFRRS